MHLSRIDWDALRGKHRGNHEDVDREDTKEARTDMMYWEVDLDEY